MATSTPPEGDKAEEDKDGLPPRIPWRGTNLSWSNSATTTLLGVGRDNISDSHEAYVMSWALSLNYYVVDEDDWKLSLRLIPSFATELTNSDVTTTEREPQFGDLPFMATYSRTLYSEGLWATSFSGTGALIFPTSPYSSSIGTYLTTSPRLGLTQVFPLLGKDSPALKSFSLGVNVRWDHRFGAATTAVNDDLDRPRQNATGDTYLSDQVTFGQLATDTLREGISLSFSEAIGSMPISLMAGVSFAQSFKGEYDNSECAVVIETGCVNSVGFNVGLGILPVPELGIDLGYANMTGQLGPDGERRDFFYSPGSEFNGTLTFNIDALYERVTGPKRKLAERKRTRRTF